MPVGPTELIIVLVIALVIFGPKRLPDLGRSLGHGMREFKDSISGNSKDDDDDDDEAATIGSKSDASTGEPATSGRQDAK
ncbi:MAG: Sec-independent protein translocase subunit TatA/TatB [Solirubrobacteraceae bacterium]